MGKRADCTSHPNASLEGGRGVKGQTVVVILMLHLKGKNHLSMISSHYYSEGILHKALGL